MKEGPGDQPPAFNPTVICDEEDPTSSDLSYETFYEVNIALPELDSDNEFLRDRLPIIDLQSSIQPTVLTTHTPLLSNERATSSTVNLPEMKIKYYYRKPLPQVMIPKLCCVHLR